MGWFNWKWLEGFDPVLNRETLSEHLPYRSYDEERGLFYLAHVGDDALGACWVARPLLGLSPDTLRKFESMFRMVLPVGATMQFSLLASDAIEPLLNRLVTMRKRYQEGSPYVLIAEELRQFYLDSQRTALIPSSKLRPRDFQLFISISIPLSQTIDTKKKLEVEGDVVAEYVGAVESSLSTLNFGLERLDELGLLAVLYSMCNPGHEYGERPQRVNDDELLNGQIVKYDTFVEQKRNGFTLDGKHVRSLTVQQFPDPEESVWHGSRNRELIGSLQSVLDQIPCRFMITLNVVFLDAEGEKARLSKKHVLLTNQYSPGLSKMIPSLGKKKLNMDLAVKANEDGAAPIGAYYHISVFGDSEEQVQGYAQVVIQHYAKFNWTVSLDPIIGTKLFLHSLPMGLPPDVGYLRDSLMRLKTLNSSVLPHLMPVVADWTGFGEPVCVLTSRSGQMVTFDPFSNKSGNFSMCVAGKSGSGKSFFMNYFITSYLGLGARFWVIDKGSSYTKICEQVGGQLISFQAVKDTLGLNPFGMIVEHTGKDAKDKIMEDKAMVLSVLSKMASPTERMTDMESRALEQIVDRVWEDEGRKGTPFSVARLLKESSDQRVRDLATRLYPFSEGKYSEIFRRTKMVEFDKPFVLLEVSGLDEVVDFRSVVLMQLVMAINREMWVNENILGVPKVIMIDEAHELLSEKNGFMGDFMVRSTRTVRKRNGGVVIITQGLEDFYDKFPPYGEELLGNSDFLALLMHESESIASLKKQERLILDPYQMALIESLHRHGKEYSEIYLRVPASGGNGNTGGVCRLVMDPLSRWMYTTDANELVKIRHYVEQGMTVVDACQRCAKDEKSLVKVKMKKAEKKRTYGTLPEGSDGEQLVENVGDSTEAA